MSDELDRFASAYTEAFPYFNEDQQMLTAYVDSIVRVLKGRAGLDVLSLGVGHGVVAEALQTSLDAELSSYEVVDGSAEVIAKFRQRSTVADDIDIKQGFFEDFQPGKRYHAIEMGFVLEHVDDPELIVQKYRDHLTDDGLLFAGVPNARSLHRLIGHEAGLLQDMYELSEFDLALGHQRYFDLDSFRSLFEGNGYQIEIEQGLLLKPLTTKQVESLQLSGDVWGALRRVGYALPELCNGILVVARSKT